jgi:hypothetical protein
VTQDHDELRAEMLCCKFNTTNLGWTNDIAGYADDKQITKALIKDNLGWHSRVRTP